MVRTRNNRGGDGDGGGGNSSKESSSSLKPASLTSRLAAAGTTSKKKGRKRQLGEGSSREEEEIGLELTHSAALSPVAGPSTGSSSALRGESSRGTVAPESHDRSSVPPGGQDQSMEQQQSGNHVWGQDAHHNRQDPAEQGSLAPPINYNNNNYT